MQYSSFPLKRTRPAAEMAAGCFLALGSILISGSILSGCSQSSSAALTGDARVGKAHFEGYGCTTCHKVAGKGGTIGPDLTYIGFRKSPEWLDLWLRNPPEWKHNTLMPNFYLKDHVRKPLVAYLATLKGEGYRQGPAPWDAPGLAEDPVKRGEVLFRAVGCVGCHGIAGKGGYPNNNVSGGQINSLTRVAEGYSEEELADRIRKGSVPLPSDLNAPPPMIRMPAWGEALKEDEIQALVKYLYSLRPEPSPEESWE